MAWSGSKIFSQFLVDGLGQTALFDLDSGAHACKAALYNNTTAPDETVNATLSSFNGAASQWVTANQVTDVTNWVSGGRSIASTALTKAGAAGSHYVMFDGTDTAGAGVCTMSGIFGCLVYDDTLTTPVADQGLCYNYFGGTQSVTGGTFTIVWHANGIFRITL